MNFLHHLECPRCLREYSADRLQTICTACEAPLFPRYDLAAARLALEREAITRRPRGMWRWAELLPVQDPAHRLHLGEGDTPLLHAVHLGRRLDLPWLYVKDESLNPTGSFKARGLAAAVSRARELGVEKVIIPTAGNAGGAMAAYAARGGLAACVVMPADTPQANVVECQITGARLIKVDGLISDAGRVAAQLSREEGWFSVSTFKEPYRVEGKKVMGYELAEAFGWRLPDVIIYPTGGGTGLVGMWKAFQELRELGWLEEAHMPRMVSVQSAGCAPIVKAFAEGATSCEFWQGAETVASGLRVPRSFADREILAILRASRGTAVAVDDDAILEAQAQMASEEGIFPAPEGAATLAALHQLQRRGWVRQGEKVVLFNTGAGLKYIAR